MTAAAFSADLPARVTVLGFARSGRALTEALVERGIEVVVVEDQPAEAIADWHDFEERGVRFSFGRGKGSDSAEVLDGSGWLALSPGVPLTHAVVVAARRRPALAKLSFTSRRRTDGYGSQSRTCRALCSLRTTMRGCATIG